MPGPALMSSTSQYSTARGPTPSRSPAPPAVPSKADYSAFSGFSLSQPTSQTTTPQPSLIQQQQQKAAIRPQQQPVSGLFASLTSPMGQSVPLQNQPSTSASLFDLAQSALPATAIPPATNDDDEWAFSSALPESNGLPSSNSITITDTIINISLHAVRKSPSDPIITMNVHFSNKVAQLITELTFQVAVTKVSYKIRPRSVDTFAYNSLGLLAQDGATNRTKTRASSAAGDFAGDSSSRCRIWEGNSSKNALESVIQGWR